MAHLSIKLVTGRQCRYGGGNHGPSTDNQLRSPLVRPAGSNECRCQSPKTGKIGQAIFGKIVEQRIEIGYAVFEDGDTLAVQFIFPVEVKYRASTDDRI
ncbi:MAG: hypothetical protein K0S45_1314 [Nitrospira sp.]|nr:hypothetical protein [Nitrospira sp.]